MTVTHTRCDACDEEAQPCVTTTEELREGPWEAGMEGNVLVFKVALFFAGEVRAGGGSLLSWSFVESFFGTL